MRKRVVMLLVAVSTVAFVAGCGSSTSTSKAASSTTTAAKNVTGAITVSAAASLTQPFTAIGEEFKKANPGTDVKFNFDSSATLVTQIQQGAPADVFASADEANMAKLTDAGLVAGTPDVFARNLLTIVVKKGNPKNVKTPADLASVGVVSLCGVDVPCGRYADQALSQGGVTIPADKITRGQNVKATLAAVADGDAEAGIVYVTDVSGDKVEAIPIPEAENVIAIYPIAVLKASANSETAKAFVDYVLGPAGQKTLKAAGFLPSS